MRGGNKAIVRNELLAILWQGHDAHWEVWGHFSSHHPTRRKHLLMLLLWYLLIPIAPILFDHYCLIWSPCYLSLRLLKQIPNSSPFSSSSAELWPQCCSDYFTEPGVPPSMPSALTLYHTKTQTLRKSEENHGPSLQKKGIKMLRFTLNFRPSTAPPATKVKSPGLQDKNQIPLCVTHSPPRSYPILFISCPATFFSTP